MNDESLATSRTALKILLYSFPTSGHINPTLPLTTELVKRGHEVIYFATQSYAGQIRNAGADFRAIPDIIGIESKKLPFDLQAAKAKDIIPLFANGIANSINAIPELLACARQEAADMVLYDPMCMWGQQIVRLLALPSIAFYTTFPAMGQSPLAQQMALKDSDLLSMVSPVIRILGATIRVNLKDRIPVRPIFPREMLTNAAELNIAPIPRRFVPDGQAFDKRYLFIGPSVARQNEADDFPLERLRNEHTLYISLGTMLNKKPHFFRACLQAFAETEWQVVMSIGKTDPATLGPIPENFIVRPSVPQLKVLQNADLFITHGGMNSTMEGLWHGVPLIAIPSQPEQELVADRIAALGLGVRLNHNDVTPNILRNAVQTIMDQPAYRQRIAAIQAEMHAARGPLQAADAIEQYVDSRKGILAQAGGRGSSVAGNR
ncbi:MAG: hypothetical protein MI924_17640 [Chloroflexales bacterium]|nr:hypothetical protein [Chloroflexales bacterium]